MSYYSRIQGDHGLLNAHDTPGKRQRGVDVQCPLEQRQKGKARFERGNQCSHASGYPRTDGKRLEKAAVLTQGIKESLQTFHGHTQGVDARNGGI